MLFKEFAGVDAFPICLDTRDPDEIVATVKAIAPGFGGINLEDISAPRCFEIEDRLKEALDIPVFHDDQHGTAVVVLAALLNALKLTGQRIEDIAIVIVGIGAAGVAVDQDPAGGRAPATSSAATPAGRSASSATTTWTARCTRSSVAGRGDQPRAPARRSGRRARGRRPVHRPVRRRGCLPAEALARMNPDPIVFAMANPTPEVAPEEARSYARIMATGRSDYPEPDQQRAVLSRASSGARWTSARPRSPRR